MALNPYYEDELSYLRELGREFADANPKLASFLGREANDPDVERLLEGFAFLVARLRQKLEDEMPELVHGMLRLLWPHYLRYVPPMSLVAFEPIAGGGDGVVRVEAGSTLNARPIDGTVCRFITSYATDVLPLSLGRVELDNRATSGKLTLGFGVSGRGTLAALKDAKFRLFFNAEREPAVSRTLLAWFLRHVSRISVTTELGEQLTLPPTAIRPVGFGSDEAVIPYPANAFVGFRLMQEYHACPWKFLFVDIEGLDRMSGALGRELTLTIDFDRPLPEQVRLSSENIRLNCTPVINLFAHDAHPIRIDRAKTEYRVRPSGGAGQTIYSVDRVSGFIQGQGGRIEITPFESIRHDVPGDDRSEAFFRERLRTATVGRGIDHYLAFVSRRDARMELPIELVSVGLTCTNGPLAERVPVGGIDQPSVEVPPGVTFRNLLPVTSEVPPPIGDALLWRLVSNLARNSGSLLDVSTLKGMIASYDFRAVYDAQARRRLELLLDGIEAITVMPGDTLVRGVPARLRNVMLSVGESKLGGEAELFLLGSVLDAFFVAYASINSVHRFSIRGSESNVSYTWPIRTGVTSPL